MLPVFLEQVARILPQVSGGRSLRATRSPGRVTGVKTAVRTLLTLTLCASTGCKQDPSPGSTPPSTAAYGIENSPTATTPHWTQATVGLQSVLPLGTPCPADAPPYRVVIEGDGEPLRLASGAPAAPGVFMACAPVATRLSGHWIVSACANSQQRRKGCLWLGHDDGAYYDREGKLWHLRLDHGPTPNDAGRVQGRFVAIAEDRGPTQTKTQPPIQTKALTLDVDVGADVTLTTLPGDYWGAGSGEQ